MWYKAIMIGVIVGWLGSSHFRPIYVNRDWREKADEEEEHTVIDLVGVWYVHS